MSPSLLEIRKIGKRFGATQVIKDVTLTVRRGEVLCILGPSGSGKTTLLRIICGFETPETGEIVTDGKVISRSGWRVPPEQRKMGMVFQDYALFPHLTVWANVAFGLQRGLIRQMLSFLRRVLGISPRNPLRPQQIKEKVAELFTLTGLKGLENRYPHELSGGQQQRVALARALATDPHLLLLDEPFSNLDTRLRARIREEMRAVLKAAGTTSILVTHDQEEAINLADRIAVMNEGRLEQIGTGDELLHAPASPFVATFVGMSDFIPGELVDGVLQTELGNFPLPKDSPPQKNMPVEVLSRPDHLKPSENGQGTQAQVVRMEYQGVQTLYTLQLPSGTILQAFFPGHPHLSLKDTLNVSFAPPRLVWFPAWNAPKD